MSNVQSLFLIVDSYRCSILEEWYGQSSQKLKLWTMISTWHLGDNPYQHPPFGVLSHVPWQAMMWHCALSSGPCSGHRSQKWCPQDWTNVGNWQQWSWKRKRDSSRQLIWWSSCEKPLNSQVKEGECILHCKLLQLSCWIIWVNCLYKSVWSSSISLHSLTCSGHLGKKRRKLKPHLFLEDLFFHRSSVDPKVEKTQSFRNPHGTSVCCRDETNWPPGFGRSGQFTNFHEAHCRRISTTKSFVVLWSAEIRIVLPNEMDDKPSTMFFVGLPIFNNVS